METEKLLLTISLSLSLDGATVAPVTSQRKSKYAIHECVCSAGAAELSTKASGPLSVVVSAGHNGRAVINSPLH